MAGTRPGYSVLVVDDDPAILDMVRDVLEDEEFLVRTAQNGLDALRIALDTPPDLIVTDLMMPIMGGRVLRAQLRTHTQTLDSYTDSGHPRSAHERRRVPA
jgi:CheY-like chemotaxis protein